MSVLYLTILDSPVFAITNTLYLYFPLSLLDILTSGLSILVFFKPKKNLWTYYLCTYSAVLLFSYSFLAFIFVKFLLFWFLSFILFLFWHLIIVLWAWFSLYLFVLTCGDFYFYVFKKFSNLSFYFLCYLRRYLREIWNFWVVGHLFSDMVNNLYFYCTVIRE